MRDVSSVYRFPEMRAQARPRAVLEPELGLLAFRQSMELLVASHTILEAAGLWYLRAALMGDVVAKVTSVISLRLESILW
jgi:hypothetical protein